MSSDKDQNNLQESLKELIQAIEENREKAVAQVMKIEAEREMDADTDTDEGAEMQILSTNPAVDQLMRIAEEEFGKWKETLVISKTLLASLFSLHSGPVDHSVLSVSYRVDHEPSHGVLQVISLIQEYEAQSAKVMDGWMNYHMNREQIKGGLLQMGEHPDMLVSSDLHAAFSLLDQKMIMDLKAELSDLLVNYSVFKDVLVAATAHMHDEEDEFDMYM